MNAVTHLFRGHHIATPSQAALNEAINQFAELLSKDRYSLREIARLMGVTAATPCVLLRMLNERMGDA